MRADVSAGGADANAAAQGVGHPMTAAGCCPCKNKNLLALEMRVGNLAAISRINLDGNTLNCSRACAVQLIGVLDRKAARLGRRMATVLTMIEIANLDFRCSSGRRVLRRCWD